MILFKRKEDGCEFYRGLVNAFILSVGMWAVIILTLTVFVWLWK